jgi:hypothetical protein
LRSTSAWSEGNRWWEPGQSRHDRGFPYQISRVGFWKDHAVSKRRAHEIECIAKFSRYQVASEADELQTIRNQRSVECAKVVVGSLGPGARETSSTGCWTQSEGASSKTQPAMSSCKRAAPFVSETSRVETWSMGHGGIILGMSVGLERPRGNEAALCLLNIDTSATRIFFFLLTLCADVKILTRAGFIQR